MDGYDFRPCLFDGQLLEDLRLAIVLLPEYDLKMPISGQLLYDGDHDDP